MREALKVLYALLMSLAVIAGIVLALLYSFGDLPARSDPDVDGTVIMVFDGTMRVVPVSHVGPYCVAAWFRYVDKVILEPDGTAHDGVLQYEWTLNTPGPKNAAADAAWFKSHCKVWR